MNCVSVLQILDSKPKSNGKITLLFAKLQVVLVHKSTAVVYQDNMVVIAVFLLSNGKHDERFIDCWPLEQLFIIVSALEDSF